MKRIVSILMAVILVMSFAACGDKKTAKTDSKSETVSVSNTAENASSPDSNSDAADKAEWEKYLDEYEAFVDKYIELVKKYKEDPTDTSILTESAKITQQITEWAKKADTIKNDLAASPEDLKAFTERMTKILQKFTDAAKEAQ